MNHIITPPIMAIFSGIARRLVVDFMIPVANILRRPSVEWTRCWHKVNYYTPSQCCQPYKMAMGMAAYFCDSNASPRLFRLTFRTTVFLYLYSSVGVHGDPTDCLQSWMPHGTTSATWNDNGTTVSTTISNLTPMYAPCGTDWKLERETITAFLPECNQTQTRNEPRLISFSGEDPGPPRITCLVCP